MLQIAPLAPEHWLDVRAIYEAGIVTGNATFETEAPAWEAWNAKHLREHRFVALVDDLVAGWVAAGAVSDRGCYAGVIEHSVYVSPDHQGHGFGRALLGALVDSSEAAGIWTIQSGIFPENASSLALHRACGFRELGTRERIGQLAGRWRDVVLVERRSPRL